MYSNLKAWIPLIGVMYADLEIFYEYWYVYQVICFFTAGMISLLTIANYSRI